jgi:hypothetical protein
VTDSTYFGANRLPDLRENLAEFLGSLNSGREGASGPFLPATVKAPPGVISKFSRPGAYASGTARRRRGRTSRTTSALVRVWLVDRAAPALLGGGPAPWWPRALAGAGVEEQAQQVGDGRRTVTNEQLA